MAYAENIENGSLFFTLSAADLHWYDLQSHMPRLDEYEAADEARRHQIASQNLNENLHIAAYWLHRRFNLFKKHVLMDLFDGIDFWFRYEWQMRGSGYIHGFLWSSKAPKPDTSTSELRKAFAEHWATLISALNPDQSRPPDPRHPSAFGYEEQLNSSEFLTACLNRFQRHGSCTKSYCLRSKKGSAGAKECRFYFPRSLCDEATVSKDQNPHHWTFCPQRNDKRLNSYNAAMILSWMANIDTSPATSISVVVNYMGKYCGKEEKKSTSYQELLQSVQPYANSLHAFGSVVAKFMNKLIAERDWLAQEVCHQLLDIPLCEGSRNVVILDCRQEDDRSTAYELKDGQLEECGLSAYKKYKHRLDEVEDITFLDFLLHFNHTNYKRRPRAKPRVISYFPRYKGDPCHPQYPDFCRIKLLLHHPWREYEEVATYTDEFGAPDYIASYQACVASHRHLPDYFCNRTLEEACEAAADIDEFDDDFVDNLELYQSFEILHARIRNTDAVEVEDPDKLGDRELDRDYNWGTHRGTYPQLDERAYWQDIRLQPLQQSHLL
jgi:ATP-dependent DNA helicase PIF1